MRTFGFASPLALTPWTRRILVANGIVYLLSITILPGSGVLPSLAFVPSRILLQPWSVATYMFVHGGLMHLAFNMLVLFFFGSAVEQKLGPSSYLGYYFLCGIGGAALSFVFAMATPIIGASAAVYGVALAFAWFWPNVEVYVFPIPFPLKTKWIVAFLAASSLLFAVLGTSNGVAHFAHLGGFLFGAVYLLNRTGRFRDMLGAARARPTVISHPRATPGVQQPRAKSRWHDQQLYEEVDRVLDKISQSGIESLSPKELKILEESSKQMRHN
ncbi:MAG: rhomboid family intramembrane serine protease [Gemmatimonadales bacterium]